MIIEDKKFYAGWVIGCSSFLSLFSPKGHSQRTQANV